MPAPRTASTATPRAAAIRGRRYGNEPELRARLQAEAVASEKGYLLAWNPVTQSEAWRVDYGIPGSGGVLATAGNLLIQGTIDKTLAIYRADTGREAVGDEHRPGAGRGRRSPT